MTTAKAQRIEGPRGSAEFSFPAPWIFVATMVGHYSADMAGPYIESMATTLGHGRPLIGFHQWEAMTGYDSKCRTLMTNWVLDNRNDTEAHHIYLRSKLVGMGVATAAMIIGGNLIRSYSERSVFDAALAHARKSGSARLSDDG